MLAIEFSEESKKQLYYEQYHHPHPKIQKRCQAVWMRSQGFARKEILKACRISKPTYTECLKSYVRGGVEALKQLNYPKHRSELYKHRDDIKAHLQSNPPKTISEAAKKIEDLTGIKRSHKQVRLFLLNCGFRFRKVGMVPSKADTEQQKEFIENELEPRLKEAGEGKRAVFFVDAAHFVMGAFLGYLWTCVRLFVKTSSGRQRFNVLGAIDAINKKLVTVTNDSYITAESVCDLLKEITTLKLGIPISLVLDNAKYQKCNMVTSLAKELGVELLFLPPYSPNLNLIERLWKFVKKKCLYSHYYEDFKEFKMSIMECLNKTTTEYKKELDSLLSPKFQSF